jgi:hypothetical protein
MKVEKKREKSENGYPLIRRRGKKKILLQRGFEFRGKREKQRVINVRRRNIAFFAFPDHVSRFAGVALPFEYLFIFSP